jgi:glycosyltransferase involved in cell wall biosynthesis
MNHKPRIVINGRALPRRITGVERYACEVVGRLPERIKIIRTRHTRGLAGHFWEQFILPLQVSSQAVLWSPANSGPVAVSRQIVTIHDLSPLEHPEWFHPGFAKLYQWLLPAIIQRARLLCVPSSYTRSRLLKTRLSISEKVIVIPNGVNHNQFYPRPAAEINSLRMRYGLPESYLLAVGTQQPRKNLNNLLTAWRLVHPQHPGWSLVIAGGKGPQFKPSDLQTVSPGVRMLGYVPDAELPILYSGARAYLSASLEEGFGLTVLEAMACGTPVLAASSGALPEVLGNTGLYFDPLSPQEIANRIESLLDNPAVFMDLALRALERSREMPWERTAQSTLELLESVDG